VNELAIQLNSFQFISRSVQNQFSSVQFSSVQLISFACTRFNRLTGHNTRLAHLSISLSLKESVPHGVLTRKQKKRTKTNISVKFVPLGGSNLRVNFQLKSSKIKLTADVRKP